MRPIITVLAALIVIVVCGCRSATDAPGSGPQATSLLGQPLYRETFRKTMSAEDIARQDAELAAAGEAHRLDPLDEDKIIWYGRRAAYTGWYSFAIDVFTRGLEIHPISYKLLRHRGHRYITTRQFDKAVADLTLASELIQGVPDEVEPDGQPNARNIPTGTSHTNIWYHLGLAHYLRSEFGFAGKCFAQCLELSTNDDMRTAAAYWLYLSWMRTTGMQTRAERLLGNIQRDMNLIENFAYQRLLLLYKGEMTIDEVLAGAGHFSAQHPDVTTAYGIAMWHKLNGREEEARSGFESIVAGEAWPAFGHIAAEAELARSQANSAARETHRRGATPPEGAAKCSHVLKKRQFNALCAARGGRNQHPLLVAAE